MDGILVRVKGNFQEHKTLFDERLRIINFDLGIPIYPSYNEMFLYEKQTYVRLLVDKLKVFLM